VDEPGAESRWDARVADSQRQAAKNSTGNIKGHHWWPENGRIFWPQPIGDSHDSVPSPMSPTARRV
jgi:hypothetical protein